ncbi:MAG: DUF3786 domain-containing protein [Proteobacteria bacterium]|nr:DUF3786 domain-containing protein [Pseudomonadota bacterium]MBU4294982.1 DUF3786 domain-containing protein [Pseudomonadota bacterium]MCG2746666.1 DUF3786 domain-containing protein [Desulfobulbaceae bacterium]
MTQIKNPLELYKLLKKSNCRECRLQSCMAFAVAVIQGQKQLADCPYIDRETLQALGGVVGGRSSREDEQQQVLARLKQEAGQIDFPEAAARLGVQLRDGRLGINCLGKDFWIDAAGEMWSECHNNPWVLIPLLNYIIHGKGRQLSGEWVAFGDLPGAADWNRFFSRRCEEAMGQLADAHAELIFEILHLFGANPAAGVTNADQSLVIFPLPGLPMLINYWPPEDHFASKLNILFDRTAADNITVESIYLLGRGLVEMFRGLIVKHSRDGKLFG